MKLYKLTDENGQTRGGTQWGPGVAHEAKGDPSQDLCSDGWIHAYTDPLLAMLLNPIHANFQNPKLFEAEGKVGKTDHGLKIGVRSLITIREIDVPKNATTQRVAFGILCALEVAHTPEFVKWAENWLSGKDRSEEAAWAAVTAARSEVAAAEAAARSAWAAEASARSAWAAVTAARSEVATAASAASAASAAARSAWAAEASERSAWAAVTAARSEVAAAEAAARSAWAAEASEAKQPFDLIALAKKAMEYK